MKPLLLFAVCAAAFAQTSVPRYGVFEASFTATGNYANPYTEASADAVFELPNGASWRAPLFWDGGQTWRVRVSPPTLGRWSYRVLSGDGGLNGRTGQFTCVESTSPGGIRVSARWPSHFERQSGAPFWFLGDTAWAYVTDIPEEKHDRAKAEEFVKTRAAQGFNAIHIMLLSEGGDGNSGGPPWNDIAAERLNPAYFHEADRRIAFANGQGLTVGIAIAWGDKGRGEKYPWRKIPNPEARKRYARYATARFAAYDSYFLVSGEWHGELRTRTGESEENVFREFVDLGNAVAAADPHRRMIGIHPMNAHGSVREFASAPWMSFADYQQNYQRLHYRTVLSRSLRGPVVNSEYAYFLRDQDEDGQTDKANSYTVEDIRFSSWDVAMGGGYLVNGFGSTYFGGRRHPGPFDLNPAKNGVWETQIGHIKKFFERTEWWKLIPADEALSSATPRGEDRRAPITVGQAGTQQRPPAATYWALADPGREYAIYVRGVSGPVKLELAARERKYRIRTFNPRTGDFSAASEQVVKNAYEFRPPDANDWLAWLEAID
jgi:hypothetical protein